MYALCINTEECIQLALLACFFIVIHVQNNGEISEETHIILVCQHHRNCCSLHVPFPDVPPAINTVSKQNTSKNHDSADHAYTLYVLTKTSPTPFFKNNIAPIMSPTKSDVTLTSDLQICSVHQCPKWLKVVNVVKSHRCTIRSRA